MRIVDASNARAVNALLDRRPGRDTRVYRRVARMVERVRNDGDRALLAYAKKFDRQSPPLELDRAEIVRAARTVPGEVVSALRMAASHIGRVARRQIPREWSVSTPTPDRSRNSAQRTRLLKCSRNNLLTSSTLPARQADPRV